MSLPKHLKLSKYAKWNQNCILQTYLYIKYNVKLPGLRFEPDGEALFFFVQPCGCDMCFSGSVSQKPHPAILPKRTRTGRKKNIYSA